MYLLIYVLTYLLTYLFILIIYLFGPQCSSVSIDYDQWTMALLEKMPPVKQTRHT